MRQLVRNSQRIRATGMLRVVSGLQTWKLSGICLAIGLWVNGVCVQSGLAQPDETAPATASASPAKSESPASALDLLAPDVIYLQSSENSLVPVLRGALLEKWLLFLKQAEQKPKTLPPPAVARIDITGAADDERATLTARIVIRNVQAAGFAPVSLALHEAVIREVTHEGPGEFIDMDLKENDRLDGNSWWISGAGDHTVTLQLVVPVKRQGADRRLRLTLPEATSSEFTLATKFSKLQARSASGEIQVLPAADQPARLEVLGMGTRLDVNWQPVLDESPVTPLVEAETKILAYASTEELLVEAHQKLHVVQGSISQVVVQLPGQAKIVRIDSRDYKSHQILPDNPSRVLVQFSGPMSAQVQLRWTIRLPAAERRKFVLDGFLVEQARNQSGLIGLVPTEGLRMKVSQADHPYLYSTSVGDLQLLSSSKVTRAYRFLSQPFRMSIGIETIEPYFTSEARLFLKVTLNELTLEGRFSLNVLRGKLRAVELDWPNWKADGWELDSIEPQGDLVEALDPETEDKPGRLRIRLVEDHADQAVLRLKARREIKAGESLPLSLPRLIAQDGTSTQLTIHEAENMTCEVTSIGETKHELEPADPGDVPPGTPVAASGKSRHYRIRSTEQLFSLRAVRQERRLQVDSTTVLELSGTRLRAVQSFQFDVQHERLAQARFAVPESWRQSSLRFQIDADRALTPQWSAGDVDNGAVATLSFPEPRLGQFTVQAVFDVPLSEAMLSGEVTLELPVLACVDQPIRQYELQIPPPAESDLTVVDANWKPRTDQSGQPRWIADGPVSSVKIQCDAAEGAAQQLLVTAAEIRADWDRQGTARCLARYRISGTYGRIQLIMPPDSQSLEATWDGRRLSEPTEITSESQPRRYTLRVRASGLEPITHVLTLSYRIPATQACGMWNQWTLGVPQLSQARWMAQGNWRIRFPGDQHLFAYSSAVTPQFRWERTGLVWSRVSTPDDEISGGFSDDGLDARFTALGPGNRYAFGQFGELREFRFTTMSGAMILFVGASISLLVGFLVLNLAALRHLMTLWAGVFLIALASLWFRAQLEVLLQPILIGFVFPLIAVWMQSFRRREPPPVMSFDPLMDLIEARSSVTRSRASEAGGPEPVLLRSPTGSTHDFLRTEAGSGVS